MDTHVASLEALTRFAKEIKRNITPHKDHAFFMTLTGELGAGKTAFTQMLAKEFGVGNHVTSPTFVILNAYPLRGEKFERLVHIDAYRLEGGTELAPTGFHEFYKDKNNVIVLEWPEQVADALPVPDLRISISPQEDGSRLFSETYGEEN